MNADIDERRFSRLGNRGGGGKDQVSHETFFDITVPLRHDMPVWPGNTETVVRRESFVEKGDIANVSTITSSSHAGTHVDPPRHFIDGGKSVDELDPAVFIGPCYLADLSGTGSPGSGAAGRDISAADLEKAGIPPDTRRLLVRTANSTPVCDIWAEPRFRRDYAALAPDGAEWIRARGISLLGWDYLSVEAFVTSDYPVHRTLLGAGVVLLEGLDLRRVPPGSGAYQLYCLPLLIAHGDGAPARALLARSSE